MSYPKINRQTIETLFVVRGYSRSLLHQQILEFAIDLDQFSYDFDLYEYRNAIDDREKHIVELAADIVNGDVQPIREWLQQIVDDDGDYRTHAQDMLDRINALVLAEQQRKEYIHPVRDPKSTLFAAIIERAKADGSMAEIEPILDYYLPNDHEPKTAEEKTCLTNYRFDIVPCIAFGTSEGIYVDVQLQGDFDDTDKTCTRIGVFKTLRTDLDACCLMGKLCGLLVYHGTAYVNENIHRYTPQGELEREYLRKLEAEQAKKREEQ